MTTQTLPNSAPDGIHHLIEFFGCCPHQINSRDFWETILDSALEGVDIHILNRHFYCFAPHGVTGYFLLSASHISIHTWPEHGYVACDVFSCGEETETTSIVRRITSAVRHERTHITTLHRGYRFGEDSKAMPLPAIETVVHCEQREECPALGSKPPSPVTALFGAPIDHFNVTCANGDILRIPVTNLLHTTRSPFQEITVCDTAQFGRCLLLDGVIQTAGSDHQIYDRAILHKLRPADRNLLILGGGDGEVAAQALEINSALHITVVELDGAVVTAAREHLGQTVFDNSRINLIEEDAFSFLPLAGTAAFDGIVCDLTDFPVGYDQEQGAEFYSRVFFAANTALKPGGWIAVYAGATDLMLDGGGLVVDRMRGLMEQSFGKVECTEALVPSFGESCCFLYGLFGGCNNVQTAEAVIGVEEKAFRDVMTVVDATSVDGLNDWDDSEDYIREKLEDEKNINILLKDEGRVAGYLLAVPHNDALAELKDADPLLKEDPERYYVNLIEILPASRKGTSFLKLLFRLTEEAEKRFGVNKFSMHTRVNTGLSRVVQRYFGGMITSVRRIEHWKYYNGEEAADYIEGTYEKK